MEDSPFQKRLPEGIDPLTSKVSGFTGGLEVGFSNFANIILDPKDRLPHLETQGILGGLGEGLGNPVNIATMFVPGGIVAGAISGAAGNTITDYLSRLSSDEQAEYSFAQLGLETATGLALGAAAKAIFPLASTATKGIKNIKLGGKIKETSPEIVEDILGRFQKSEVINKDNNLFVTPSNIRANEYQKNGILATDDMYIDPKNPFEGLSRDEIDTLSKVDTPDVPEVSPETMRIINNPIQPNEPIKDPLLKSINDIYSSPESNKYLSILKDTTLKEDYMDLRNASLVAKTYGVNPEEVGFSWRNLEYKNRQRLLINMEKKFHDNQGLKQFSSNLENKPYIYKALYDEWDSVRPTLVEKFGKEEADRLENLAFKAASIFKVNNKIIVDTVNSRGKLGYIENRAGRQVWLEEKMNKVSTDEFYRDLSNTAQIHGKDGWRTPTFDDAKYIKNNLSIEGIKIMNAVPTSKQRVIKFKTADDAFAMEVKYGNDDSMQQKMVIDAFSGSKTMATTQMFGMDINQTLKHYKNIIPKDMRDKMENLLQTLTPPAEGSAGITKFAISSANLLTASLKITKSIINPYYQLEFVLPDLPSVLGNALHTYGKSIFTDAAKVGWKELKEIGDELNKFAALSPGFNREFNKYEAMSAMSGITKKIDTWANNIFSADAVLNGSHYADKQVRNFQSIMTALGESQRIKAGGTIPGVDRKYVVEATLKGTHLPNGDLLIDKANRLRENGGKKNSLLAEDYANAGSAINAYFQKELNKTNPIVYRELSLTPKGSVANLWALRAGRWVWNSYINIQAPMWKSIVNNFGNNWNQFGASLGGLLISSVPVGIAGTLFDYMHHPEDFKDEGSLSKSLAKNIGLAIAFGSVYIPTVMSVGTAKEIQRIYKAFETGDKKEIWKAAGKSSFPIMILNYLINGKQ